MIKFKKHLINQKLALKQNMITLILKNLNLLKKILKFTSNILNKALKKDHLKPQADLMAFIVSYINYIILIKKEKEFRVILQEFLEDEEFPLTRLVLIDKSDPKS